MARRSMYTNMIRPIITWGAELWFLPTPNDDNRIAEPMRRCEYKALRRITGAFPAANSLS